MKKKIISIGILAFLILGLSITLTSCNFIKELMGKGTEENPPEITSTRLLKTYAGYLESKEYLFNFGRETKMALAKDESFFIEIAHKNPAGYAITSVKVNGQKIMANEFDSSSTKLKTVLKFTPEASETPVEENYRLDGVYYNTGSATKAMKLSANIQTQFSVINSAVFRLSLDQQNADRRSTSQNAVDLVSVPQEVTFGREMSTSNVPDKDYTAVVGLPEKKGGWIFEGYYTEPNGGGFLVKNSDKYFFWEDIKLYAYYTRLFEYEVVELDAPIRHEYSGYINKNGKNELKTGVMEFNKGVVITKDATRGFPKLNLDDTIVDEKVSVGSNGVYTVTAIEYPIVKVGKEAFLNVNTVTDLKIGKYIKEIEYKAFDNNNKMRKVTFTEGSVLTTIGDFAFQRTKALGITEPVTLPESVSYLGNFAFRYSGWGSTTNNGRNESVLQIKPTYKFIGAGCFFDTGFIKVVFDPGCKYESQIDEAQALTIDEQGGWKTPRPYLNQIGARIFANCSKLEVLDFEEDKAQGLGAVNIIPDRAFDVQNYTATGLSSVTFGEGIQYIGKEAFSYQSKLTNLILPASLKEIAGRAFYNNKNVNTLTFPADSKLTIIRSECFGKMENIDRVVITSSIFEKYGNGPFNGCSRLKSIEFPNINSTSAVPKGFDKNDTANKNELLPYHEYSDFLAGTFTVGTNEDGYTTYSLPVRVFCKENVMGQFKSNLKDGKKMDAGSGIATGTDIYEQSIFVFDINLVMKYTNPADDKEVTIALQKIYSMTGATVGSPGALVGYSLAFWSDRSENITVESVINDCDILEIGMYALPNCVKILSLPSSITRIEHDAFNGYTNLTDVNYANIDALEYIGDFAFMNTKITSFEGGTALRVIGQYAFANCKAMQWVDLQKTIIKNIPGKNGTLADVNRKEPKKIYKYDYELQEKENKRYDWSNVLGGNAFSGCAGLSWVYLPKQLTQLRLGTFMGCKSLRTIIMNIDADLLKSATGTADTLCFYESGVPTTIIDEEVIRNPLTCFYIKAGTIDAHEKLLTQGKAHYATFGTDTPGHP